MVDFNIEMYGAVSQTENFLVIDTMLKAQTQKINIL